MSVLYLEQEKQVYWLARTLEEALLEWAGPPLQKQDNVFMDEGVLCFRVMITCRSEESSGITRTL